MRRQRRALMTMLAEPQAYGVEHGRGVVPFSLKTRQDPNLLIQASTALELRATSRAKLHRRRALTTLLAEPQGAQVSSTGTGEVVPSLRHNDSHFAVMNALLCTQQHRRLQRRRTQRVIAHWA
ncbi:hypothetical protein JKP88DRAFT_251055 [Tribonema minus]|uniref:Uncharacterized protein n=1 Tax=Tribonema minus TaxID=303371 RepID=A0A835ZG27_9STRA|nr:hypothetical protein JKP88DRAFT_251055 [Tribonema minus]